MCVKYYFSSHNSINEDIIGTLLRTVTDPITINLHLALSRKKHRTNKVLNK